MMIHFLLLDFLLTSCTFQQDFQFGNINQTPNINRFQHIQFKSRCLLLKAGQSLLIECQFRRDPKGRDTILVSRVIQESSSLLIELVPVSNFSLGMRLLCSKIYLLCYVGMLQTMSNYALGVSLLCSRSKLIN